MPTCATITQCLPMVTLWAICTRLSIFVPSPISVSRPLPRSMRVGADLDVVADDHAPELRHLEMALRPHREAEPILPDAHAGVEDDPVTEHYVRQAHMGGDRAVPTDAHTLSNHAAGADPRARSDLRLGPTTAPGSTPTPSPSRAVGWIRREGTRRSRRSSTAVAAPPGRAA